MNWFLIAIILNVQSGEPVNVKVVDKYADAPACVQAAFETGPQSAVSGEVTVFSCRQVDENGVPLPEEKVDGDGKPLEQKPAVKGPTTTV